MTLSRLPIAALSLREQVDGAQPRRLLADLGAYLVAELALVGIGELAVEPEAELAGDHER